MCWYVSPFFNCPSDSCLVVACGREFTLIATKPYIGPSREELEKRAQERAIQEQRFTRQSKNVREEQKILLARIQHDKRAYIIQNLNTQFPKCEFCKIGTICPGYQRDPINPAMCKHCMHERRKHNDLHNERDTKHVTMEYLMAVITKLGIEMDYSSIPDIDKEEELEQALEEYE